MNKKQYLALWIITQSLLFILPIIVLVFTVPYQISYDEMYVEKVIQQAEVYDGSLKATDFTEATRLSYQSEGKYIEKEWKLQNKEIYWYEALGGGFLLGLMFQMFNLFWKLDYDDY